VALLFHWPSLVRQVSLAQRLRALIKIAS
jgi:hypothetical protein